MSDRRTYRLNEVEELFDNELKARKEIDPKLDQSKLLRYCIRKALSEKDNGMSPEQANKILVSVFDLKKELSKVGGNLNQIAHYFNTHNHLIEGDLHRQHRDLQDSLRKTTQLLSEVLNGIRRSTY